MTSLIQIRYLVRRLNETEFADVGVRTDILWVEVMDHAFKILYSIAFFFLYNCC